MNPIIFLLQTLFNIGTTRKSEPVRLQRKSPKKEWKRNQDLEIIIMATTITLILVCLCLLLITSCTDSGLVYNNHW